MYCNRNNWLNLIQFVYLNTPTLQIALHKPHMTVTATLVLSDIIALWWCFTHAVLGVPCETTRHGCSLWCLYPHYPFSIHIFCLVINIEKTSLVKYWAISIFYQFTTIGIDLKICIMSKALKSKMIRRCCIHNTFGKTMGPHVTMATQLIVSWQWRML